MATNAAPFVGNERSMHGVKPLQKPIHLEHIRL